MDRPAFPGPLAALHIAAADWPQVSALFDEALDLAPQDRGPWLERLPPAASGHREALRALLAHHAGAETNDFLGEPARLPPAPEDAPPAPAVVEGYRLLREIGRGGMGSVWLAERSDGLVRRNVALKLPHPGLATRTFAERLARERDILASLEHPNIARLYDAGVTREGQPYIALEYVPGRTLVDHCDSAALGLRERLALFSQMLAAVHYAHVHLVVHRDLKPSNVLVDEQGQVRLLDFGIAKLLTEGSAQETELTREAGRALTPDYASPEQIAGEPVTTASDLYTLGVLLYQLLTGTRPYHLPRGGALALEAAVAAADVRRPSEADFDAARARARATSPARLARALRGDLDTIVLKALKKRAEDRYGSAEAFAADLARHLQGEPVLAQPDSAWYRTKKLLGRHRLAAASAAAVLLAVVGGLGVATWQAQVARTEAQRAQAVQGFLLDIFRTNGNAQGDPVKARQTTARELLDIGARRVDESLKDAPQAQAEVLDTLADMYIAVGLDDAAASLVERRVGVLRRLHGDDDPRVAEALMALANALWPTARRAEGVALLEQARAILDRHPGSAPELRATLLVELSRATTYGPLDASRAYAAEAADLFRRHAPDEPDLVSALLLLAWAQLQQGDPRGAERSLNEGLGIAERHPADSLGSIVTGHLHRAAAKAARQDIAGAEAEYREVLAQQRQRNGDSHVDTLQIEARLGLFLHSTSRRAEGLAMLESALRRMPADATPNLSGTLRTAWSAALLQAGRANEAATAVEAEVVSKRHDFPHSMLLVRALARRGELLAQQGRLREALAAQEEALQMWRPLAGTGAAPSVFNPYLLAQAKTLLELGDTAGARARLQQVQPPPDAAALPLRADEVQRDTLLAALALREGHPAAAAAEAQAALQAVEASPVRAYFGVLEAEAALQLGRARQAAGDAAGARALLERGLALH